jgi:hypothetical protein
MRIRRVIRLASVCLALAGCGGGPSTSDIATSDAGSPVPLPLPPPGVDAGAKDGDAAIVAAFGPCGSAASKPVSAGSVVDARSGATLHWPDGWSALPANQAGGEAAVSRPYTYVPTGASTPSTVTALVSMSTSGVSSDAQGEELVENAAKSAAAYGGDARSIVVGGHPATLWWDHQAPPQPGCQGCVGDPGPDIESVGVTIYLGTTPEFGGLALLEVRGAARQNATPNDLFCDMQAMALGLTLAR